MSFHVGEPKLRFAQDLNLERKKIDILRKVLAEIRISLSMLADKRT